jgi:hypothetical protein
MFRDLESAYEHLKQAVAHLNVQWSTCVISGEVWSLPILSEQVALKEITPVLVQGRQAIEISQTMLQQFELEADQAPGTVKRLPGWFLLSDSVLEQIRNVNRMKDVVQAEIERVRLKKGLAETARTRLAREALGARISLKQLTRHIQAFDATPRLLSFTWAGHTGKTKRVPVGEVRSRLERLAQLQMQGKGIDIQDTPAGTALRVIHNLADHARLVKVEKVAPHPRVNIFFSHRSRYDAMLHANLPLFFLAGEQPTEIVGLKDFNFENRIAPRRNNKDSQRIPVLPEYGLYMDEDELWGRARPSLQVSPLAFESTYRARLKNKS